MSERVRLAPDGAPNRSYLIAVWCLAILFGSASKVSAQQGPELWLMAWGDSVVIQVTNPPVNHHGFMVDRSLPGGEWERLTDQPVRPARHPAEAVGLLGNAYPDVRADLRASNDTELLRRLRADSFTGSVMSMLYPEVAHVLGRRYVDAGGVTEGAEYEYRVVFVDWEGKDTEEVRRGRVRIRDIQPGVPEAVRGEIVDNEIVIEWKYPVYSGAETDFVHGFHIERAVEGGEFARVTPTAVLRRDSETVRWQDREFASESRYRYRVRAVDIAGRLGEPSTTVTVAAIDDRRPGMPAQLATEPGDGSVLLSWPISPEASVVGYIVQRSRGLEGPYNRITDGLVPAESPTFNDSTAHGGIQYFYRIVAVDERGNESEPSNAVGVTPYDDTPPEPVSGLTAVADGYEIHLSWEPSPSPDVRGYNIYRGESLEHVIRLTSEPHEATGYIDSGVGGDGLNPGGRYMVQVSAVDHSFNESERVTVEVEIIDDVAPEAPVSIQATNFHGRYVELRWAASPSRDVAQYELTRYLVNGRPGSDQVDRAPFEVGVFPADRHDTRDTTAVRGESYRYELVAVDSAGNRADPIDAAVEFRGPDAPPAPRRITATVTDGGVRVRWERASAPELVGYHLYRSTSPTGIYELVSELIGAGEELVFTDRNGREGHFYTIRAVDVSGNESRSSPAARARVP